MAQSSDVSAGQDATALSYNNLRVDVFGAHHSDALGTLLVNADIAAGAAIALSKLAALTVSRALVTDGSGVIVVSAVTAVELGYLSGLVSKPVANSGDESVAGIKTFGSIPVLPASDPTTDNQAARKAYVDAIAPSFKCGIATRDMAAVSGVQNIAHGLGRVPRFIRLTVLLGSDTLTYILNCMGTYNGSVVSGLYTHRHNFDAGFDYGSSSTYILWTGTIGGNPAPYQQQAVPTWDATNIILTWTKIGSPTGVMTFLWEAY